LTNKIINLILNTQIITFMANKNTKQNEQKHL
jgi:hypothetical protein